MKKRNKIQRISFEEKPSKKNCSMTSCRSKKAYFKRKQRKKSKPKKITYSKLTFILSVIGFIGSLGFYFGVLRQVYAKPQANEIKQIQQENENLKSQVNTLTRIVNECQNEKE